jgi:hypothetical protein
LGVELSFKASCRGRGKGGPSRLRVASASRRLPCLPSRSRVLLAFGLSFPPAASLAASPVAFRRYVSLRKSVAGCVARFRTAGGRVGSGSRLGRVPAEKGERGDADPMPRGVGRTEGGWNVRDGTLDLGLGVRAHCFLTGFCFFTLAGWLASRLSSPLRTCFVFAFPVVSRGQWLSTVTVTATRRRRCSTAWLLWACESISPYQSPKRRQANAPKGQSNKPTHRTTSGEETMWPTEQRVEKQ